MTADAALQHSCALQYMQGKTASLSGVPVLYNNLICKMSIALVLIRLRRPAGLLDLGIGSSEMFCQASGTSARKAA
jgi:hypothetical protein